VSEPEEPKLSRAVADYREHKEAATGARALAAKVAMVGSLGWLVVLPALLGTWGGWWLDRRFQSGVFWTAAGVLAGTSAGFYLLWRSLPRKGGA
jgi:ATP synthase protein I